MQAHSGRREKGVIVDIGWCTCLNMFIFSSELLKVIKETENDDLTEVLQELIETYSDNIADVAVELCSTLVSNNH